jgi:hypothetical protein
MYRRKLVAAVVLTCLLGITLGGCKPPDAVDDRGAVVLPNPYPAADNSRLVVVDGKVGSPVLPYGDLFSEFTRLPLGHTQATGKGIRIAVIGTETKADFVYYAARESEVLVCPGLRAKPLEKVGIKVVAIEDFRQYPAEDLRKFVQECLAEGIAVTLESDLAETEEQAALANELEALGAVSVGRVTWQGTTYVGSQGLGKKTKGLNINVFAPGMLRSFGDDFHYSLYGVTGALTLVLEKNPIGPAELKTYLTDHSRGVWQMAEANGTMSGVRFIDKDPVTSQFIPNESPASTLFFYRQLDFARLLGVELTTSWNANMYNLPEAWKIARGNVDVALIDESVHPDAAAIKNNIAEIKTFGQAEVNGHFHGTAMAAALLTTAPAARIHMMLVNPGANESDRPKLICEALNCCVAQRIPVVSMSWGQDLASNPELVDAIRKARDAGTTVVWFWYPQAESGVIRSWPAWGGDNAMDRIGALDRFVQDDMFYPQEFSGGWSPTAPQVAGLIAMVKEVAPQAAPEQIRQLLSDHAAFKDAGGWYIPDMNAVLQAAMRTR